MITPGPQHTSVVARVQSVTRRFGDHVAVDRVSLQLRRGQIAACSLVTSRMPVSNTATRLVRMRMNTTIYLVLSTGH